MSLNWDVLGMGAIAVDDLIYVDGFPAPDSKVRVQSRQREGGGLCATALVAAARLGATVAFCGALGNDELSQFSRRVLEKEGVDSSQIAFNEAARPHHSTIIVDRLTGSRTILSDNSGVREVPLEFITTQLIAQARVLFVDHTIIATATRAAQIARDLKIPVVADIERIDINGLDNLLPLIDHLIIGLDIARAWSAQNDGADAAQCLAKNHVTVIVTDGARGCWSIQKGDEAACHTPAFVVDVVDTTGCGDVFHGAYAASLARGDDLQTRIQIASATAAIKATQRGGQSGIPTRGELEAWLGERA